MTALQVATDLGLELLAMLVYGNVLVLFHEAGHAALARAGGFRVTSFAVGLGPPLLRLQLPGGVVLHLDRWPLGGSCTAIPRGPSSRRRAWYHAGGLIVQAGLALLLLGAPEGWLTDRLISFNLLVAATNALPWRVGRSASDGWYLLDTFRGGRRGVEVLPQRARLEHLARRELAVGSPLGSLYAALCLAWADVLVGRLDRADVFFQRDSPQTAVEPWVDVLYTYVRAEWHRAHGRALAALRTLREARTAREGEVSEGALGLLTVAEARALVDLDALDQARDALARITGVGGPIGRQASAIYLRTVLEGPAEDVEAAAARVVRRRDEAWLDPADVVEALTRAMERLAAQERPTIALQEARDALAARVRATAAPDDREALGVRLSQRCSHADEAALPSHR